MVILPDFISLIFMARYSHYINPSNGILICTGYLFLKTRQWYSYQDDVSASKRKIKSNILAMVFLPGWHLLSPSRYTRWGRRSRLDPPIKSASSQGGQNAFQTTHGIFGWSAWEFCPELLDILYPSFLNIFPPEILIRYICIYVDVFSDVISRFLFYFRMEIW